MGAWKPILDGPLAARAHDTVQAIAARLATPFERDQNPSLAGGAAGTAVLYAYLARAWPERTEYAALRDRCLDQAIDAVATQPMPPGFYSGFTGIGWALEHVALVAGEAAAAADPAEDPNEGIDEALLEFVRHVPTPHDYDLIVGLVGLGVYAVDRVPRPSAVLLLEAIIDVLARTAREQDGGVAWWTDASLLPPHQRAVYGEGYWNLGLAHGVPGVIGLLGRACAAGVAGTRGRTLLDGAVTWLLAQRLPDGKSSRFPGTTAPGVPAQGMRAAWCYGDPGIAAALMVAARGAEQPAWEQHAVTLARECAGRPVESAGVIDAGLCHGAAGLAHIYQRFHALTGEALFADVARSWFERTLDLRKGDDVGLAGYLCYEGVVSERAWVADPGFLTGVGGIALALLAAVEPTPPRWGRILLVE